MLSRDEFIYTGRVSARPDDSRYRLAQLVGDRRAVLDVGCAVGYLGEFLRQALPDRWIAGIELDPGAAATATPHYDQMLVGSIEDERVWDQLERKVEAMVFGDVLEHTSDPLRVLRVARRHLTEGGTVVMSIPNIAHARVRLRLLLGRFEYEEWGIMDRTHLRFFTRSTGGKLLQEAGYQVVHVEPVHAFPRPSDGAAAERLARSARAQLRNAAARVRPTLVAKQFIYVARLPSGSSESPAGVVAPGAR